MGISLLVAVVHAGVLRLVGLELWLVFGVLAFLLNFIPNVGMATAVLLYMHMCMYMYMICVCVCVCCSYYGHLGAAVITYYGLII